MLMTDAKKVATLILSTRGDKATQMADQSRANLESRGLEPQSAEEIAAAQLIDAIHAKNAAAVVKSFRAFWALCEATEYED